MYLITNEKRKQLVHAATILIFAGSGICLAEAGRFYETAHKPGTAMAAVMPKARTTASPSQAERQTKESTTPYEPSPDKLNLAYYYPEGSDTSDIIHSYAGQVFQELTIMDTEWLANLYELADVKPLEMAADLGLDASAVRGSYNEKVEGQDPDDPDTWVLKNWKKINVSFIDGDGKRTTGYSNVKDILAMASVYTYYTDMLDSELFSEYARQLWENSHSYTLSVSDVYYCSGCLDKTDEEIALEEEALESAAISMLSPEEEILSPEDDAASGQRGLALATASEARPSSGTEEAPLVIRLDSNSETVPAAPKTATKSQATASPSQASSSSSDPSDESQDNCPGHVDLNIRVQILGLSDTSGLYQADTVGTDPDNLTETWEGWTETNKACVDAISSQDWFADYGLSVSSLSLSEPLTEEEIQSYMDSLPDDLSQVRRDIIYFALNSVGKVPYYWGGKASYPGYEGNNFGALVSSDEQGRILKGLDCSGWIAWVYWSVTGERLAGESTSSLILCGEGISRSELQPGDIVVRTGTSAHVVMFLGWSADGQMNVIHESSASVNNVTIKTMEAAWPYYRKLVE